MAIPHYVYLRNRIAFIEPSADGGDFVVQEDGYNYHYFESDGVFTPSGPLSVDYCVIGGGGGYGGYQAGANFVAGGAGGILVSGSTVVSTPQTITVGLKSASSSEEGYTAPQGGTSSFGAIASATGGFGGTYSGIGGSNAQYSGNNPGGTQSGAGAGAGGNASGLNGGIGKEWPIGSGQFHAGGGCGRLNSSYGTHGAGSQYGAGANAYDRDGFVATDGVVIVRYLV